MPQSTVAFEGERYHASCKVTQGLLFVHGPIVLLTNISCDMEPFANKGC